MTTPNGMVWWRFKGDKEWSFGFCSDAKGAGLVRMGAYNGDYTHGVVVSENEIEWKEYRT
jgi:hypothetical protein